jgi:hypothetical protein
MQSQLHLNCLTKLAKYTPSGGDWANAELPFAYDPAKAIFLISKAKAFPFAAIITDLDRQFMLALSQYDLYLPSPEGDTKYNDILSQCTFHEDPAEIKEFCCLFHVSTAYQGVSREPLMTTLERLEFMDEVSDRERTEVEELYNTVTQHFEKIYAIHLL